MRFLGHTKSRDASRCSPLFLQSRPLSQRRGRVSMPQSLRGASDARGRIQRPMREVGLATMWGSDGYSSISRLAHSS